MAVEDGMKSFIFTWELRNFKYLKQNISSPIFSIEPFDSAECNLCLLLNKDLIKDSVVICIKRGPHGNCSKVIELEYRLSVFANESSLPSFEVPKTTETGRNIHIPFDKINVNKLNNNKIILPKVLIIVCEIWRQHGSLTEDGKCLATTDIKVERMYFDGVVENVSDLTPSRKQAIHIKPGSSSASKLFMNILITPEEKIFIEVVPVTYEKLDFCHCMIYLKYGSQKKMECGDDWFPFSCIEPMSSWKIPLTVSKSDITELKELYCQRNCTTFKFQIKYSTGVCISKIIKHAFTLSQSNDQPISDIQTTVGVSVVEDPFMPSVKDDLISLLSTVIQSDLTLQTDTETLPAHKAILSARSVFRALFTNVTKEKTKDSVQIEDFDADTFRRKLLVLFSDSFKEVDFESVKKLYLALDIFLTLKYKCSRFFQDNLNLSNCCDVLMLADEHKDADLKNKTQDYIAEHDKEVLKSDQWKNLEKSNPSLGLETFHIVHQKYRSTC